jgi:hypothetical protein
MIATMASEIGVAGRPAYMSRRGKKLTIVAHIGFLPTRPRSRRLKGGWIHSHHAVPPPPAPVRYTCVRDLSEGSLEPLLFVCRDVSGKTLRRYKSRLFSLSRLSANPPGMAVAPLSHSARDYVRAFGLTCIALWRDGRLGVSRNPAGAEAAWWCPAKPTGKIVRAANANGKDVIAAAARLHTPLTPHGAAGMAFALK